MALLVLLLITLASPVAVARFGSDSRHRDYSLAQLMGHRRD